MGRACEGVIGRIFDIQRFSIHDGPGIRTIVFLKGCALGCRWCSNPESQEFSTQTMYIQGKPKIIGEDRNSTDIIREVLRDQLYYRRSGGGITLSGGEALCQPEFAAALLKEAKESGINTAIETTAYAPFHVIEGLMEYVDYFLCDIKHMDAKKHKEFTGVSNERILENIQKISDAGNNIIIRVPIIPNFNIDLEDIQDILDFVKRIPSIKHIHFLPFHRLGYDKYLGLSRDYQYKDVIPPSDELMKEFLVLSQKAGLIGQIGG